jgi:hypothetical protein
MSSRAEALDVDRMGRSGYRDLVQTLAGSARAAGRGAVVSGRWLAETVVDLAPRVPVRDAETLARHHAGITGAQLAQAMVSSSGRMSAAIGAAAGGLVAFQEVAMGPSLVAVPFEVAAETVLVVLVELKLVAELHQVAGRPLAGSSTEQMAAALRSWLTGRGITSRALLSPGRADLLSRATRTRLTAALRRRFTCNLATLVPLLAGSVAAGWLNSRATLAIGRKLAKDLGL